MRNTQKPNRSIGHFASGCSRIKGEIECVGFNFEFQFCVMSIDLKDYQYSLPEEKIAAFPLDDRASSKLLTFKKGSIGHRIFRDLPTELPPESLLVFNNTRVIPARLIFQKATGARIEVFLLEPAQPSNYEQNMGAHGTCTWHCMIGNAKRWKSGEIVVPEIGLKATRVDERVTFNWSSEKSFSEILEQAGKIPLPPYIHREVQESDKERYQTVYSRHEGAVAAPTAGLHFTDELLAELRAKGFQEDFLTLHVSAGTFQPMKADTPEEHPMHRERIIITQGNIDALLSSDSVIPVGTTSMRTLESLYWYGVKLLNGETDFFIPKLYPYEATPVSKEEALRAVKAHMTSLNVYTLIGHTEIFIFPGYRFRICNGLITNFHLPGSTLILLVAALIGDNWREVYKQALENDYRFLSYGDSSLLLP
jgi:S-adenosylmethionine:tRNA ribosyltransferase-isomerase